MNDELVPQPLLPGATRPPFKSVKKKVRSKDGELSTPQQDDSRPAISAGEQNLQRLQRLQDLMQDAITEPNPLQSNLRATAGDVLALAYRLQQAISTGVEHAAADVAQFEKLVPSIELYLKLTRQADRFAQIDFRLFESRHGKSPVS
ncbi:MAG: hypothetical protein KDB11_33490 [Planctomycetales bacterium]|nr:hypothetical protein [Planctomycetales bacterium]